MMPLDSLLDPGDDRLLKLLAGVCRQAIQDWQRGYHSPRHADAGDWLRKVGLLRPDGTLIQELPTRQKRTPITPQEDTPHDETT